MSPPELSLPRVQWVDTMTTVETEIATSTITAPSTSTTQEVSHSHVSNATTRSCESRPRAKSVTWAAESSSPVTTETTAAVTASSSATITSTLTTTQQIEEEEEEEERLPDLRLVERITPWLHKLSGALKQTIGTETRC